MAAKNWVNEKRNTWRLLKIVDNSKNGWCYAIFCKFSIIIFCKILFLRGAINDEERKNYVNEKMGQKNRCILNWIQNILIANVFLHRQEDGSASLRGLLICCFYCMKDEVQGGRYIDICISGAQIRKGIMKKINNLKILSEMRVSVRKYL